MKDNVIRLAICTGCGQACVDGVRPLFVKLNNRITFYSIG